MTSPGPPIDAEPRGTRTAIPTDAVVMSRPAHSRGARGDLIGAVLVGLLAAVVSWFRQPGPARDTIWAEDGTIFLKPLANGQGWQVLEPYSGYLHVVARLVTGVSYLFAGVTDIAVAVIVGCCVTYGIIAGLVFYFSRDVLRYVEARIFAALITVVAPVAGWEALHNVANLHWFLFYLGAWLLLATPRTRVGTVLMAVLALAITLTEVQAFILAPIVLWRWRSRISWPVFTAFGAGLVAQFVVSQSFPRGGAAAAGPPWQSTVAGYLLNNGVSFWTTDRGLMTQLIVRFGWWAALAAAVPLLLMFAVAFVLGRGAQRTAAVYFLAASGVAWVLPYVLNHVPGTYYTLNAFNSDAPLSLIRWATASSMFLLVGIALAVDALGRRGPAWRRAGGVVLVLATIPMLSSLTVEGHDRAGTPWHEAVVEADQECRATGLPEVSVPIQPDLGDWVLDLPCVLVVQG